MVRPSNKSLDDHEESENPVDGNSHLPLDNIDNQDNSRNVCQSNDLEGAVGYSDTIREVNHLNVDVPDRRDHDDSETGSHSRRRHSSAEMYQYNRPRCTYRHSESAEFSRNGRSRADEKVQHRHNHHDILYAFPQNVPAETAVIGLELYIDFLREEIRRRNLQEPECLMSRFAISPLCRNKSIINIGHRLQHIANDFACTPLRQEVRRKAESVPLQNLDFQSFSDLLYGLFQEDGVTSERVVVLFFFCSDLAIRALCNSVTERFHIITQWIQWYIVEKLSVWVQQHGGWATVFEHSMSQAYRVAMIGLCCIATAALLIFIRRNLK